MKLILAILISAFFCQPTFPQNRIWDETEEEKTLRLSWWTEARFGMFIHWGIPGQLNHPELFKAQQTLVDACIQHNIPAGIHVVSVDHHDVRKRIEQGMKFIACGLDTLFLKYGCQAMLRDFKEID